MFSMPRQHPSLVPRGLRGNGQHLVCKRCGHRHRTDWRSNHWTNRFLTLFNCTTIRIVYWSWTQDLGPRRDQDQDLKCSRPRPRPRPRLKKWVSRRLETSRDQDLSLENYITVHKETEAQILHLLNTQYFICVFVDYYSHNIGTMCSMW